MQFLLVLIKHCYLGVSRHLKEVLGSQKARTVFPPLSWTVSLLSFTPNTFTPICHPRPEDLAR